MEVEGRENIGHIERAGGVPAARRDKHFDDRFADRFRFRIETFQLGICKSHHVTYRLL